MLDFLAFAYSSESLRPIFGERWTGPDQFERGRPVTVAEYQGRGDGKTCRVEICALPATFATVVIPAHVDHEGTAIPETEISTGSGEGIIELAHNIATAVADGMLVVRCKC